MWIRFGEWLLFCEFVCSYSKVSRPPFLLSEFYDLIKFLPIITFIVIFLCRIATTVWSNKQVCAIRATIKNMYRIACMEWRLW